MRLRKVCPQCNTVVHTMRAVCDCSHAFASTQRKARCTAVGESENAVKRRKALVSEEELLVTKEGDKVRKASKRASETRGQTLHRQQNRTHLACAEGSALPCCSLLPYSNHPIIRTPPFSWKNDELLYFKHSNTHV